MYVFLCRAPLLLLVQDGLPPIFGPACRLVLDHLAAHPRRWLQDGLIRGKRKWWKSSTTIASSFGLFQRSNLCSLPFASNTPLARTWVQSHKPHSFGPHLVGSIRISFMDWKAPFAHFCIVKRQSLEGFLGVLLLLLRHCCQKALLMLHGMGRGVMAETWGKKQTPCSRKG